MAGLPTLKVRQSVHEQKIFEMRENITQLKPRSLIMKNFSGVILSKHIEELQVDIEILTCQIRILREEILLKRINQKIKVIEREHNLRDRINNINIRVDPPSYEESIAEHDHEHVD